MSYRIFVDREEIKPPKDFSEILDAEKGEKKKFITEQMKSAVNSTKKEKEAYYASIAEQICNVAKGE